MASGAQDGANSRGYRSLLRAAIICAVTFWIYAPALPGGWIWDDARYISENTLIQDPSGYAGVWTHPDGQGDYYPLTSFVEWLEWHLWGNQTLGYHLVNVVLHLLSAFLFARVLTVLGIPRAWIGALIFAVSPIMVESVAWITELKNTLSLPPLLLAILAFLDWEATRRRGFYFAALACFALSLLAKTAGMMLPLAFLLHAWWRRGTVRRCDREDVAPFFAIAFVAGLVTVWVPLHAGHGPVSNAAWSPGSALAAVGWSTLFLLGKALFPAELAPVYPSLAASGFVVRDTLPWFGFAALFAASFLLRAEMRRAFAFGLGFFLLNLVPVLFYIGKTYPAMVWSMDHLLYLPVLGLIGIELAALNALLASRSTMVSLFARCAAAAASIAMALGSHAYAGWYVDNRTLWTRTLAHDPASWIAHNELGGDLVGKGDYPAAIAQLQEAIRLQPGAGEAHYNLGLALEKSGRVADAEAEYRAALALDSRKVDAWLNEGMIRRRQGDLAGAAEIFREGLAHAPGDNLLTINLAAILSQTGDLPQAIQLYQQAVLADPSLFQAQYNLGAALLQTGDLPGAAEHLQRAVSLQPDVYASHQNFGVALARLGLLPAAIEQFRAALQLQPGSAQTRNNLALALAQTGQISAARQQYRQEIELHPEDEPAKQALAKLPP